MEPSDRSNQLDLHLPRCPTMLEQLPRRRDVFVASWVFSVLKSDHVLPVHLSQNLQAGNNFSLSCIVNTTFFQGIVFFFTVTTQ